jgi:hypothetical protein
MRHTPKAWHFAHLKTRPPEMWGSHSGCGDLSGRPVAHALACRRGLFESPLSFPSVSNAIPFGFRRRVMTLTCWDWRSDARSTGRGKSLDRSRSRSAPAKGKLSRRSRSSLRNLPFPTLPDMEASSHAEDSGRFCRTPGAPSAFLTVWRRHYPRLAKTEAWKAWSPNGTPRTQARISMNSPHWRAASRANSPLARCWSRTGAGIFFCRAREARRVLHHWRRHQPHLRRDRSQERRNSRRPRGIPARQRFPYALRRRYLRLSSLPCGI